ncbi:MAG: polyprenol monophosphomannose synthase [Proteobacteria bacterium]|nr:polyprenol monophosphomannose synthase [Pseudomonadota bacterium]
MKVMVVIPTYNERDNIERLTDDIIALDVDAGILIVDDNSPDGTGDIADEIAKRHKEVHVLHREGKQGLGSAYRAGFKYALGTKAEYIVQMDADFSHNPASIIDFLAMAKEADVVVGSRYLNGVSVVNWPIRRLMLSYFANMYTRVITGLKITDCTGGFKCFNRKVLEAIDLDSIRSDGYSFQIEMNHRATELGFAIAEIPIIFIDRHAGSSKMSKKIVREAVLMVWRLRIGAICRNIFRKKY